MSRELEAQLAAVGAGDHLCLVYEEPAEQLAAVAPFVRMGLERGERCLYIVDDRTAAEVAAALEASGIDVGAAQASGALVLATKRETYLRAGHFDPVGMLEFLGQAVEETLAEGYGALRITGEMTWALGPEVGCDRLMEYEKALNGFFPGSRALAICQYNRHRFPAEVIRDVLRTHPVAILGEQVCPNLYYEPPDFALDAELDAARVEWMIEQLRRVRRAELHKEEAAAERERLLAREHEARLAAESAIRYRDEFLSAAAHELKTPATSLRGYAQVTLRRLEKEGALDPARVRRAMEVIDQQTDRLSKLVEQLLDVSRISVETMTLDRQETDVAALVRSAVVAAAGRAGSRRLRVAGPAEAGALVDPIRMEQVVNHLLDNAIRFSPEGSEIDVAVEREGDALRLTVRDRGIGIPAEQRERIFERFYQANASGHLGGLGLGLFITREIVQLHGGSVRAEAAPGGGTAMVVTIPA